MTRKANSKKLYHIGRKLLIGLLVVLILLVLLLLVEIRLIKNPIDEIENSEFNVSAGDDCAIIAGQLVHAVNDDGACRNTCIAECESREANLKESQFSRNIGSCNECNCICE